MSSFNESCEPMEVDVSGLSGNSINQMDISYGETVTGFQPTCNKLILDNPVTPFITSRTADLASPLPDGNSINGYLPLNTEVKKYHIVIQKPIKNEHSKHFKVIFALLISLLSIFVYQVNTIKCGADLNLNFFGESVDRQIFGQSEAMNMLLKTLEVKTKSKLIFFYGGTGVGKTFVSSLLLDSLGSYSNVYHYLMPTFKKTYSLESMIGLTLCESSVLIVDDLTANNINIKEQIEEIILKSESLDKNITVILIFNCQDSAKDYRIKCNENFYSEVMTYFADIKALKKFVKFEPLTPRELRMCVQQELGRRILSEDEYDNILKNFNVTVDGCKGVHSKLKYMKMT